MKLNQLSVLAGVPSDRYWTSQSENESCITDCTSFFADCTIQCDSDQTCVSGCNREYVHCSDLCPCNKKCPTGCPCPYSNQYCSGVSRIHILAFNPFRKPNEDHRQFKFSWFKTSEEVLDLSHHITTPPEYEQDRTWLCSFQLR